MRRQRRVRPASEFRSDRGLGTAVAFSSPLKLAKVLGPDQRWLLLTAPALRGTVADLDVIGIVIDPAGTMTRPAKRVA
ncbi:SAV_915 family protein [Nonomuraea jabiensis]|uniref:SAV_915 family protein n=1 Tax=Nonomuraea jabiensis TaxID=882448 RepID=UPI003D74D9FB